MARPEYNPLSAEEAHVILNKGTEPPFSGEYDACQESGTFICRQCNAALYRSDDCVNSLSVRFVANSDSLPDVIQPDSSEAE